MFQIGNGRGGFEAAREYPFTKDQWIAIFGGCGDCEEGRCNRWHEFGWQDVERATGWSARKQARWLGVNVWELEATKSSKASAGAHGGSGSRDPHKALKDSYERRDHFTVTSKGKDNVAFSIAPALEERGFTLPKNFSGTSEDLAATLKMDHKELAKVWKVSEKELRQLDNIRITH